MKTVIIGGTGHIGYALAGIRKSSGRLTLNGFASAIPEDMPNQTSQLLFSEFQANYFKDWREMLDTVKPDVAIIATRFDLNGTVSLECLQRGVNCFTEKTVANSIELLNKLEIMATKNNCLIIGMHGMGTSCFYAASH